MAGIEFLRFALTKPGRQANSTGLETSQTCSHMPPFSDGTGPCAASPRGIHSTSEAGQLYSYCILNYQDSGVSRDPCVFQETS